MRAMVAGFKLTGSGYTERESIAYEPKDF